MAALRLLRTAELGRFLIAGLVNTGVSYGVYAMGLWLGAPYPLANFLAMVIGVLVGFVTQGRYVFRKFEGRRFPAYVMMWLVLWLLNVALIALLLPAVRGNRYVAGAIAMGIVVSFSFVVQKYYVFAGGSRQ